MKDVYAHIQDLVSNALHGDGNVYGLVAEVTQFMCDREVNTIADAYQSKGVIFHPAELLVWMRNRKEFPISMIKKAIDKLNT